MKTVVPVFTFALTNVYPNNNGTIFREPALLKIFLLPVGVFGRKSYIKQVLFPKMSLALFFAESNFR